MLDDKGRVVRGYAKAHCEPVRTDATLVRVGWREREDLSDLAGKTVRLRFYLRNGSLYAFWVTSDGSGASHGYVAAGGPGLTGPTDTIGVLSCR